MVLRTILFILLMTKNLQSHASGFDAYSSCYRTSRKRQELPCDFGSQTWCNIPGNSYPWHAVRRFVHENQGLMRRMYGDERHISVLRAELENNDVELVDNILVKEEFRRRYSKDIDRTKEFVKILMNSDHRKLFGDVKNHKRVDKVADKFKKSIEDTSNNVLYNSHSKDSKDGNSKTLSVNKFTNKTMPKILITTAPTSTTPQTTSSNTIETTYETFMSGTTVNYTTTAKTSTTTATMTTTFVTDPENSIKYEQTDSTVQPTTQEEDVQYNLTTSTVSSSDSQYDEVYEYDAETEEPATTLGLDLSTSESFIEEDFKEHKSGNDEQIVEKTKPEKEEATSEPSSPEPSPVLRLKGINACPVKEEVVAPFWANNTRGEVLALLNLYPFEQYVHWEKCMYEHKQMFCREGCRCEQQYRLHRLLAYDPNNECRGIFSDWFRFPSCCVCKCYNLPLEFRLTSRSPRFQEFDVYEKSNSQFSPKSSFSVFNKFVKNQSEQRQRQP